VRELMPFFFNYSTNIADRLAGPFGHTQKTVVVIKKEIKQRRSEQNNHVSPACCVVPLWGMIGWMCQ
jgi:hypothetical protein